MTFELIPRDLVFAGVYPPGHVPDTSSGNPRIKLRGMPGLAVHYTGVDGFDDPGDSIAEIRAIQRNAAASGRYGTGWEYGYVIGLEDDDLVYEYAGEYLAYHIRQTDPATGRQYNYSRASVLILAGPSTSWIPDRVVDKVRWLYARLVTIGVLASGAVIQGHRDLVQTPCPGDAVYRRIPAMREPWTDPNDLELTMSQYDDIMAAIAAVDAKVSGLRSEESGRYKVATGRYQELRNRILDVDSAVDGLRSEESGRYKVATGRYQDLKAEHDTTQEMIAASDPGGGGGEPPPTPGG